MADAIFESLLDKTATWTRPSVSATPNSFGEREVTPGPTMDTIKVSLQPNKEKFELEYGGYKYLVELVLYTTFEDLQEQDLVTISGKTYMVIGVENEGGQDHHIKAYVVKR